MSYATRTEVTVEKSRAEIERLVTRFGGTRFETVWEFAGAVVTFEAKGRRVKFVLPLADTKSEQAVRSRWRSLALCIKAKIEAVESGISSFEAEFLSFIVLPGGGTVLAKVHQIGMMPPLMLGAGT